MVRVLRCLLAASLLSVVGACAQDVGDIDRTQAGLLRKSVFQGEWLMRRTVIEAPYDIEWTFIGEQDEAVRIRWDIQQDKLVAWRVTPQVDGTTDAAPAGAWPITAHVDVKRQYSETTGEQANVIEENSSDRLWFEREYVRVDWSNNLISGFAFVIDGLAQQPMTHTLWDPADPDRFLVGVHTEDGAWEDTQDDRAIRGLSDAHYIDFVTRVAVEPDTVAFDDGAGGIVEEPACWYYLTYDCAPGVVSIRNSFMRLDAVSTDFAPLPYPDNRVARDAAGKPIRVRWNEDGDLTRASTATSAGGATGSANTPSNPYAETDTSVARIPFFDKFGYFRIERDGYDPLYGEVESSKTYLATLWNIWKRSHGEDGAQLPYKERGYRPVVYYLSPGFPERLRAGAQKAADQWNESLLATVRVLDPSGDPPRLFELRDNTRAVDPATGKVTNRGEAIGDLRYSHIWLVDQPTRVGLLGYGPSALDPITGEILAADAFIYGAAGLELAARGRDMVELINGNLDPQELALGDAVAQAIATGTTKVVPPMAAKVKEISKSHRGAAPTHKSVKGGLAKRKPTSDPAASKLSRPAGWADARLTTVTGTSLEALLASDAQIVALKGGGAPNLARTSPVRWASPAHRRAVRERMRALAKRNIMLAPLVDDAVAGLAMELKDEDPDTIVLRLEDAIIRSTIEHEVGHTLGLRHNFEGSTDALNYHDGYWDLRGEDGEPLDELTDAQSKGRMRELQYSSIMDYAGRFNMDTSGLGKYDRAAIAFGYGGLVEVFDQAPADPLLDVIAYDDDTYDRTFTLDQILRGLRHYTRIPAIMGGLEGVRKRSLVPYTPEVAKLMGRPVTDSLAAQLTGDAPWTHWEVPYRFCSDEYEGGTGTCHVYDAGADSFEIVADAVERWRSWYWFYAFRRDRVLFDEYDYMDVMWYRTYGLVQLMYQSWVFDQWFQADTWEWLRQDPDFFGIADEPWEEADDAGLAGTAAAQQGLRFLFEVLSVPEPGAYNWDPEDAYSWQVDTAPLDACKKGTLGWESDVWCADGNVPLGTGRWFLSLYDVDSGYGFYDRLKWVGSFYDKLLALEALTSPETYFLGIDTFQSADEWAISMNLAFGDEIRRLLTGIAADRFDLFAGTFDKSGSWTPPDPFGPPAKRTGPVGGAVDPQTSFTIQLYALWYGMAWLNANYDNSFNDFAKVWLKGSGEAIDVDPAKTVSYTSPFNGRTYVTLRPDEGAPPGVGATMIDEAIRLQGLYDEVLADPEADPDSLSYYSWRIENLVENVEVVRGLHSLYGMLVF